MHTEAIRQQRDHKAVRERLFGKPNVVNLIADSHRVEKSRRLRIREAQDAKRRAEEARIKRSTETANRIMASGIKARFVIDDAVSYWCFDCVAPTGLRDMRDMKQIAICVLAGYPGVTLDDLKSDHRQHRIVAAKHDVVATINRLRPEISTPVIGRFMNKDHTTILYILDRLTGKKDRSKKSAGTGKATG